MAQRSILFAEDDDDHYLITGEAFENAGVSAPLERARDGEELMATLYDRLASKNEHHLPAVILLDLNMPKKDGREALKEIKAHPELRKIPVIIMTTSTSDLDVQMSYELGANSFITKPMSFTGLIEMVEVFNRYWFEFATVPSEN